MTEELAKYHIIATIILRVAYLATGLLFCYLGRGLLEKGISGNFSADGAAASHRFKIVTSSPGLVFMVAGLAIILLAISRQTSATFPAAEPAQLDEGNRVTQRGGVSGYDLATPTELRNFAMKSYEAAVEAAKLRDRETAVHALLLAVLVDPSLLNNAQDNPALNDTLQDHLFQTVLHHRVGSSSSAKEGRGALSPEARNILSWSEIYARSRSTATPAEVAEAESIATRLPSGPGLEPAAETIRTLELLVETDPWRFVMALQAERHHWLFDEARVGQWLHTTARQRINLEGSETK